MDIHLQSRVARPAAVALYLSYVPQESACSRHALTIAESTSVIGGPVSTLLPYQVPVSPAQPHTGLAIYVGVPRACPEPMSCLLPLSLRDCAFYVTQGFELFWVSSNSSRLSHHLGCPVSLFISLHALVTWYPVDLYCSSSLHPLLGSRDNASY